MRSLIDFFSLIQEDVLCPCNRWYSQNSCSLNQEGLGTSSPSGFIVGNWIKFSWINVWRVVLIGSPNGVYLHWLYHLGYLLGMITLCWGAWLFWDDGGGGIWMFWTLLESITQSLTMFLFLFQKWDLSLGVGTLHL